jgi:hypothetical protein
LAYFLNEVGFSAGVVWPNAWTYSKHSNQAIMKLLLDQDIGKYLARDLVAFARKEKVFFPPQILLTFEQLIADQGLRHRIQDNNYYSILREVLHKYYSQGKFLADDPKYQDLSHSVTGRNRVYEAVRTISSNIEKPGTALFLFSGNPDAYAGGKTSALSHRAGVGLYPVTVDKRSLTGLRSYADGGEALVLGSEVLPASPVEATRSLGGGNMRYEHYVADLPQDRDAITVDLNEVVYWDDARGGWLYLGLEKLLEHATWIFESMAPGSVLYISKGISRWVMIDLALKKKEDGSLKIIYALPGLNAMHYLAPRYDLEAKLVHEVAGEYNLLHAIVDRNGTTIEEYIYRLFYKSEYEPSYQIFFEKKKVRKLSAIFVNALLSSLDIDVKTLYPGERLTMPRLYGDLKDRNMRSKSDNPFYKVCESLIKLYFEASNNLPLVLIKVVEYILSDLEQLDSKNIIAGRDRLLEKDYCTKYEWGISQEWKAEFKEMVEELGEVIINNAVRYYILGEMNRLNTAFVCQMKLLLGLLEDTDRNLVYDLANQLVAGLGITTAAQGVFFPELAGETWARWQEKRNSASPSPEK